MLLQEFDCGIKDKKCSKNLTADDLSRIVISDLSESPICDHFLNDQLSRAYLEPWFAYILNYLVTREMPKGWNKDDKAYFLSKV